MKNKCYNNNSMKIIIEPISNKMNYRYKLNNSNNKLYGYLMNAHS